MNLTIEKKDGKTVATVTGRIDTTNADQFKAAIQPLMEDAGQAIEMDCSGLTYTSSQGLRLFLLLQKAVTAQKGSLVLTGMTPQVKEVFDITGFTNIIKIL